MARTTVSLDNTIYSDGKQRQKALRYKSFSQYVEYLIDKDTRERPDHIMVREEPAKYPRREKSKHRHHQAA